jgi:alkylhydroperoxidase family enzyme
LQFSPPEVDAVGPSAQVIRPLELAELSPALRRRLRARVRRLGYLGGFFRVAGHQPEALLAFNEFTEAGKAALSDDLVELIAITCSTITANEYELHQHERLATSLGLEAGWVREVERVNPDAADLPTVHRTVQRYVLAALTGFGRGARDALALVVESLGEAQAVAVMLVCGRYVAHSLVVNSCEIAPPVPSIFGDPVSSTLASKGA